MYVMVRLFVTLTFLSGDEIIFCDVTMQHETYTIWQNFSVRLFFISQEFTSKNLSFCVNFLDHY